MSEAPLKATLKAGTDYDAPWLSIDGTNPDDLKLKLDYIQTSGVLDSLVGAANMLKAVNNVGNAAAPQQQALAQGSSFGGGDHGLNAPQQQNQGWGGQQSQQQAQPQQAAPQQQQQQGQSRYGGQLHPEGKQCNCGKTLEKKQTSGGKQTWRCPDWRWQNGNPNSHDSEFIN